ncbi:hypothetical protein COV19_01565 [Candidatus Woesearchaeota archaeon CG10_big_fil_rev_8_21_14_0_10_44_13]|nr:MAG: hypothetical protein COV19_01565 [Candidatus Woesearchaeota archaeon CG10_big_fil_rev_8_21_14_0_10_44_13]
MRNKHIFMAILTMVFLPKSVFADVVMPISLLTMPLIPLIVLAEFIVFWIARRIIRFDAKLYMLLLAVFLANILTSALGTVFPLYKSASQNMIHLGEAFALSVLVEWGIYELFFRKKIDKKALFVVSLGGNVITYLFIVWFFMF